MSIRIGVYQDGPAVFDSYNETVVEAARLLIAAIESQEPRLVVDHIGSTAVPGCAGKGVIDLAVTYAAGDLERARTALDTLGFQRQQGREPFPETRPMRIAALFACGAIFNVHAHVIERDGVEHRELLFFRDTMRADSALRAAYEQTKRRIVESGITDTLDYCNAKTSFIQSTLGR